MAAPFDPTRPFLRRTGLAAGLTDKQLRGPGFRPLFRGVFVAASTPATALQRVQAALRLHCDQAWASHASAARVIEAPIPTIATEHVSVPHQKLRRQHDGIRCHVGGTTPTQVVKGVRMTASAHLFVEMASFLGLVDLVVLGDWLVRRGRTSPAALVRTCEESGHKQGRRALQAARYVRRDVDSPMETRLRMLLVLAGLPEPTVNHVVRDETGEVIRKYDLCYAGAEVAVEYNGKTHVEILQDWEQDLERRADMDEDGWRLVVIISSGIYKTPEQTVQRVWRVLRARGVAGTPSRPSDAWRAHFPGHASAG